MWSIRQQGDQWEVVSGSGDTLTVVTTCETYQAALAYIGRELDGQLATQPNPEAGLLPEPWRAPAVVMQAETGDGRDFSQCAFTWRDPGAHLVPLMLQTETEMGHFGAELAGFWTEAEAGPGQGGPAVLARGRFYDNEAGREFRDMLQGGRRFGISADPGAVEAEWICERTEEMDFGDGDTIEVCVEDRLVFHAYEVIGCTGTPFPGFADAYIELDVDPPAENPAPVATVAASAGAPVRTQPRRPPLSWFDQPDLDRPTPLTVSDTGRVFGHVAAWGTCHIGRTDVCLEPPSSDTGYAYFRTGAIVSAEGRSVPVGAITMGIGHAALTLGAQDAAAHYDDSRYGVADVAAGEDAHGIWIAGSLRPHVTEDQVYVLRASSLSGDWRRIAGNLEMVACLAVNVPGFPIPRAVVAAGVAIPVPMERARTRADADGCTAMVASGLLRRVTAGDRRRDQFTPSDVAMRLAALERRQADHDATLRLLAPDVAERLARRLKR